ncbi:MAG: hypothetical protein Kow00124_30620 [Anaerolineae bacterium]
MAGASKGQGAAEIAARLAAGGGWPPPARAVGMGLGGLIAASLAAVVDVSRVLAGEEPRLAGLALPALLMLAALPVIAALLSGWRLRNDMARGLIPAGAPRRTLIQGYTLGVLARLRLPLAVALALTPAAVGGLLARYLAAVPTPAPGGIGGPLLLFGGLTLGLGGMTLLGAALGALEALRAQPLIGMLLRILVPLLVIGGVLITILTLAGPAAGALTVAAGLALLALPWGLAWLLLRPAQVR